MKVKISLISLSILLAAVVISACAGGQSQSVVSPASGYSAVHSQLEGFYSGLGGDKLLGPAITAPRGRIRQYFQAGILEYDPESELVTLVPVGVQLGVQESPSGRPGQGEGDFVDGYWAPQPVLEAYQEIGPQYVGKPLTNYRYNETAAQYEMYFENLGFYVQEGEEGGKAQVRLLPYGAWGLAAASGAPSQALQQSSIPILPEVLLVFDDTASRLGQEFTGKLLVALTFDDQGNPIRIYENTVMVVSLDTPGRVRWLDLPNQLGIQPTGLVERIPDSRYYFQPLQDDKGHNVPMDFWRFIAENGGLPVSGNPITEIYFTGDDRAVVRQCFNHICLDYFTESAEIRPAPLGREYEQRLLDTEGAAPKLRVLSIKIWEAAPTIRPDAVQEIYVFASEDGKPIKDVNPVLEVTMPDGKLVLHNMPPTAENGQTFLRLPLISAENGTIIPYQVCVPNVNATRFCVQDSFLIWMTP
jgi:hypothetical protein